MSDYWKAIELALQQRYKVNVNTGEIFGPRGQLQIKRHGRQQYPTVRLHVDGLPGTAYSVHAHKVIAFVLWGWDAFQPGVCVRHLDGNTENNRADNLALGTYSQNNLDKEKMVRVRAAKLARAAQGSVPLNALLSEEQVVTIKAKLTCYRRNGRVIRGIVKELAQQYNVSPSTISSIGKGRSWARR